MLAILITSFIIILGGCIAFYKLYMPYDTPETPARPPETPPSGNEPAKTQTPNPPANPIPNQSARISFCLAIRDYEGKPGDLNYILNNPGDCRCSVEGYLPKYGNVECVDTDTDPRYPYHVGKFAKFPTYELGWEYLLALVDERIKQHPSWTFYDFFSNYAPSSDSNFPSSYAKFVANRCGVSPTMKISAYIS